MKADKQKTARLGERKAVILTVDDDPNNLSVVRDCLVDCNYTVLVAEDGESAVQRADYAQPDLILLDVMMPGIDGYETCRRLKALASTREIPVIFMTALAETGEKVKGLTAGAVDYITKPFQREELLARIAVHLHNRELTKKLQDANELLESRVSERTSALARTVESLQEEIAERTRAEEANAKLQGQLNQAQKMEAIGVLAGGIAHDFNNILAVILGYAELTMDDAPPDSRVAENLQCILTSVHRAKNLVRQILAFSRQSAVARSPIKIQPLIKESLKMLRSAIPSTITIREEINPQCEVILADPTQVHQIVMNLGTNAYHAMEKNGGVLSVALRPTVIAAKTPEDERKLDPGEYVEIVVSDTGSGIEAEILDRIFDPYFTTKAVGKGTGMGLSISHGIVKSHGGAITVESTLGVGTTFHVYFPVAHEPAAEVEAMEGEPGGHERILFVDDEEALARMGGNLLERLGYAVTTKCSSFEALTTFMNDPQQFDLVITDQTMPGLTGTELARRMLQLRPDLPVILCTGFSNLVDEESAHALGIREFAFKPLSKPALAQLIRKLLDGPGGKPVVAGA